MAKQQAPASRQEAENLLRTGVVVAAAAQRLPGIDIALADRLTYRGITDISDLFWHGEKWFQSPKRHWLTPEERELILGAMRQFRKQIEAHVSIKSFLYEHWVLRGIEPMTNSSDHPCAVRYIPENCA